MKRYGMCILLSLIMITTAISGCVGEDENALVGEWYISTNDEDNPHKVVFNSDGTVENYEPFNEEPSNGNWSINDNGTINLRWDASNDNEDIIIWFVIDGDYLFLNNDEYSNCDVWSRVVIDEDTWSSTVDALTLPSICEGIGMDPPQ